MNKVPYYIIVKRSNQALLSFLKVRVIVNGTMIVPLLNDQPVIIPSSYPELAVVATDGFHITRPLSLQFSEPSYYTLRVECVIGDLQLLGGGFLLAVFYLLGFATDLFILKLLSFVPIILFLVYYYIKRKEFIRIVRA